MRRFPNLGWRPDELLAGEGDSTVLAWDCSLGALDRERKHDASDSERNPPPDIAPAWRSDGDTALSLLWATRPKTDRTPHTAHPPEGDLAARLRDKKQASRWSDLPLVAAGIVDERERGHRSRIRRDPAL